MKLEQVTYPDPFKLICKTYKMQTDDGLETMLFVFTSRPRSSIFEVCLPQEKPAAEQTTVKNIFELQNCTAAKTTVYVSNIFVPLSRSDNINFTLPHFTDAETREHHIMSTSYIRNISADTEKGEHWSGMNVPY